MKLDQWLWYSVRRKHLDDDLERVSSLMRGEVIEVGIGRGGRRGEFRPPVEEVNNWWTVDFDPARNPHVNADSQALPFASEAVDVIVCLEVLEYVPFPQKALEEFHRLLRPGGRLLLSAPFFHRQDADNDYWRFTENGLKLILQRAGFKTEDCFRQGGAIGTAINTLKYLIYILPLGMKRRWLGRLLRPVMDFFWKRDQVYLADREETQGFATGYLVVASKASDSDKL